MGQEAPQAWRIVLQARTEVVVVAHKVGRRRGEGHTWSLVERMSRREVVVVGQRNSSLCRRGRRQRRRRLHKGLQTSSSRAWRFRSRSSTVGWAIPSRRETNGESGRQSQSV